MTLSILTLVLALWQQPARTPAARSAQQRAAFDTTGAAVNAVGDRVADVKSGLELFRRAVFNGPDGEVLSSAELFGARCRSLDSAATAARPKICRSCSAPRVNTAFTGYRQGLPDLARTGSQCAARLQQLAARSDAAKGLRREVRSIGAALVAGLTRYERRVQTLRQALGTMPPRAAPAPVR